MVSRLHRRAPELSPTISATASKIWPPAPPAVEGEAGLAQRGRECSRRSRRRPGIPRRRPPELLGGSCSAVVVTPIRPPA
jgi:hypothetical protein